MENEKVIDDYPTYSVTRDGQIRDLRTGTLHKGHKSFGYYRINLTNPSGTKGFLVHRLVAKAFIPFIDGCSEVDHLNRDGFDNRVENLRWANDCIQSQNREFSPNQLGHKFIHKDMNRYKVQITRNYQKVFSKRFDTLEQAIQARDEFIAHT